MRKALTAKTIDALKPGPRRYDVHDILCPGLSVRVGKQGQKTFTVKYRYGLKQRRLRLGVHPRITLVHAREKALDALRQVDEGIDPAARRRQLSMRVEGICEDYIRQYAKPRNSSWRETERILQREFVAAHGQRDIREIRRSDILEMMDGAIERGATYQANRIHSNLRRFFNWCLERGIVEASWAQAHPEFSVTLPQEPDGQRWEDANALEQARQQGRWIDVDPRITPLVLEDPEPRFLPFIEMPSKMSFVPWEDYRVALNDSEDGPNFTSDTVVTYYSSWQLLQFAEVVNMGVTSFMNLVGTNGWPSDDEILAAPRSVSWVPIHGLRGFEKHSAALDAIVWFAEEFSQGYHFATRQDFSRRMVTEAEIADIAALREWSAQAACQRHGIDLDALIEAVRFLCEQWCEWHRMGRPFIADAYKLFAAQGIKLATIRKGLTVEEFSERLGRVGGYFKPITQVIWPDWASEQRGNARRVLQSYNGERSHLKANFSDDLIERFLDFIEAHGLHGFYWRLESFNCHAFKGNEYSLEGLKGDLQGMALIVEHLASALGAHRTQLNQKFKQLWAGDAAAIKLLNDNTVMKIDNGKTIDLNWFEARNVLSLPEQTAADLAIAYAIRGGAHRVIEETNPMKLERMMLIMLRAAVKTFDAATSQKKSD